MANVSVFCFFASYLVVLGLEAARTFRRTEINRVAMLVFGLAGIIAHTWYLVQRNQQTDLPPLLSSTHDWLLVLAWLAVVFYLFVTSFDKDLAVGVFLLPLVLVLIGAAYFVSDQPNALVESTGEAAALKVAIRGWAMLHASLLVFGIGGVLLSFVLSLMYLAQHHRLRRKQTSQTGLRLPNLERLARLNWWTVILSVPLLTLGMATGLGLEVYSSRNIQPVSLGDPVVLVNGGLWLVMVVLFVWLLRADHPAGKQVAWMTIWACGLLLVTLLGLQIFSNKSGTGPHQRSDVRSPAAVRWLSQQQFLPMRPLTERGRS